MKKTPSAENKDLQKVQRETKQEIPRLRLYGKLGLLIQEPLESERALAAPMQVANRNTQP
jgi:hypothetical protein